MTERAFTRAEMCAHVEEHLSEPEPYETGAEDYVRCLQDAYYAGQRITTQLLTRVTELETDLASKYWEKIREENTQLKARVKELELLEKSYAEMGMAMATAKYNHE